MTIVYTAWTPEQQVALVVASLIGYVLYKRLLGRVIR